jgi:acyl-CoA synthetase (NDP forming)
MDFAIDVHKTKVIGLFMETVRDPQDMIIVLKKANEHRIPVVAIKVGRTSLSARLAMSHSGAMAGTDAAYQALFDRYGVQRVDDMDEFAHALMMFAQPHPVADGGLVCLHDSGGERQLLIDLADSMAVPLAQMNPETIAQLEQSLDPGLPAINPLDAWGAGGSGSNQAMKDCLAAMMNDPDAAFGAVVQDRGPLGAIYPGYVDYMQAGHKASGKPVFLVANRQGSGSDPLAITTTREGLPVLDGLRSFLAASKCLFAYRDFCKRALMEYTPVDSDTLQQARLQLANGKKLNEADSSSLLGSFGLPVNPAETCVSQAETIEVAGKLGYPVVLKTAGQNILHKTEQGGVHLDIINEESLIQAYQDLSRRLGPKVLVAPYISKPGMEMVLGMIKDEQFGPLVMLGFGGINVEVLNDVVFAIPPFDEATARRMINSLKHHRLLGRQRVGVKPAIDTFCKTAADFSAVVAALADDLEEIDLNPVIVHAEGCIALDALVVGNAKTH